MKDLWGFIDDLSEIRRTTENAEILMIASGLRDFLIALQNEGDSMPKSQVQTEGKIPF